MKKKTLDILLIEDDEVDVMQMARAFRKKSLEHRLHLAKDGLDALEKLRPTNNTAPIRPQVILLDINMPRMNGLEFLKALRNDPKLRRITVFILTTSTDETDKARAYEHNVAGYIIKPISVNTFDATLEHLNSYWNIMEFPAH